MKKATLQENLKPCTKKTSGAKQGRKVEAERKGEVEGEKRKREEEVLVSPSSVVTELCYASPCCSDWEFVEPQSLSLSKKACTLWYRYAGRDEVRRITSESTSHFQEEE